MFTRSFPAYSELTHLFVQFLSAECMSAKESRNLKLHERIREFQRFDGDTGSSEVQGIDICFTCADWICLISFGLQQTQLCFLAYAVAVLTEKISQLSEHMKVHRKDFGSRRSVFHTKQARAFVLNLQVEKCTIAVYLPVHCSFCSFIACMLTIFDVVERSPIVVVHVACRGLEAMLSQRRVLLQYMRQRNFDMYAIVLNRLGLKDNYAKKVCAALIYLCLNFGSWSVRSCRIGVGVPKIP